MIISTCCRFDLAKVESLPRLICVKSGTIFLLASSTIIGSTIGDINIEGTSSTSGDSIISNDDMAITHNEEEEHLQKLLNDQGTSNVNETEEINNEDTQVNNILPIKNYKYVDSEYLNFKNNLKNINTISTLKISTIKMKNRNKLYFMDIIASYKDKFISLIGILDTGATVSTLPHYVWKQLNIPCIPDTVKMGNHSLEHVYRSTVPITYKISRIKFEIYPIFIKDRIIIGTDIISSIKVTLNHNDVVIINNVKCFNQILTENTLPIKHAKCADFKITLLPNVIPFKCTYKQRNYVEETVIERQIQDW